MSGAFHPPASRPLRRWLHADERGSVVAESDASGQAVATYAYGPWGELDTTAGGRFRYTGQALIPELGLYYYKARMYSAYLGRFLQTDPAGYADGLNLYAYAGGDPINAIDPSGLAASAVDDTAYIEAIIVVGNKLKREPLFVGLTITGGSLFNFGGSGGDAGGSSSGKDKPAKEKQKSGQCAAPSSGQSDIPRGAGAKSFSEAESIARRIANEELARTQRITDNYRLGGHNDIYDAERHARWLYRMSVAIGSGWAGLFATGHEGEGMLGGQPFIEMQMDISNNSLGMNAAINGAGIPTRSTPGLTYIRNGQLVRKGC